MHTTINYIKDFPDLKKRREAVIKDCKAWYGSTRKYNKILKITFDMELELWEQPAPDIEEVDKKIDFAINISGISGYPVTILREEACKKHGTHYIIIYDDKDGLSRFTFRYAVNEVHAKALVNIKAKEKDIEIKIIDVMPQDEYLKEVL